MHRRQQAVVGAMRHAWDGYVKYAWGHDELDPVGKTGKVSVRQADLATAWAHKWGLGHDPTHLGGHC